MQNLDFKPHFEYKAKQSKIYQDVAIIDFINKTITCRVFEDAFTTYNDFNPKFLRSKTNEPTLF
ncbi:hypothetical protein [Campylobacter gastrosuis]|uniref:Transposase n=1 Tax=Campylobacter gastrosuis TaxID=2974576 RepID=A0ABT7HSV6_9BACT|nr:hypothetical protein [Campylobacter gastrosuis]MDL0090016.1 hypothetical protein [Campylobacter gastrosuis]